MDSVEKQNEAQEKTALSEAIGVAKRKQKDMAKKMMKKVTQALIKAIVPMILALLKVLLPIILATVIISLFVGTITNWFSGSSDDDDDMEPVSSSQVSTTQPSTTEETKQSVINSSTSNEALKNELSTDARLAQFIQWQTDTGYNAELIVAIILEQLEEMEFSIDILDTLIEALNTEGQKWKEAGYTTVQEIAEAYVGDETATVWANNILARLENSNIIYDKEEETAGDGYTSIYVKAPETIPEMPKKYRNYKQIQGSYIDHEWIRYTNSDGNEVTTTIKWDGCCLTSIATIVSGYMDEDITPLDIVMEITDGVGYMSSFNPVTALNAYNIRCTRVGYDSYYTELTDIQKQNLINHVKNGKPAIIYVLGKNGVRDSNGRILGRGISNFTSTQHWMAVLDYDEASDKLYVSNPSSTLSEKTGWIDSDIVLTSCAQYIAITN